MQLRRLKLQNFRQHAETELVLGPGLTAIIGPNGAGKTTLLEAIAWAFYGAPAARGTRDSIRWDRAPARSQVRVEVDFVLGVHEYRVVRGLNRAELYQDRFDAPVANAPLEVTARVERLLGMDRGEFFNTYFTGQKELAVMAAMGPAERARFLSRLLGYEKLREAQDRVRGARSVLKAELAGLERGLADPEELAREEGEAARRVAEADEVVRQAEARKAEAERAREAERPAWRRWEERRDAARSLQGDRAVAERDVGEARREFERLDRELAEALAARARLDTLRPSLERVGPLREELERLEQEARAAGRRRTIAGSLAELAEQARRVQERIREMGDSDAALAAARAELDAARQAQRVAEQEREQARTAWVRDRQDAETKLTQLRDQYKELEEHRKRIQAAGPEGTCPTCARPLGAEFRAVVDALARQLEEVEVQGKFFRQRREQLEAEPAAVRAAETRVAQAKRQVEGALERVARGENQVREGQGLERESARAEARRADLERELAELPDRYDAERHDWVRTELSALDPAVRQAAELRVKAERAEGLVGQAEAAERDLSERERRVAELDAAIADLGFSERAYGEARARFEETERDVRDAELALASGQGDRKAAVVALDAVRRRIRERQERAARVAQLQGDVRLHEELDRAMQELRIELNEAMRPELAERASAFLAELTDGRYAELDLDERYEILVLEEGIAKPVISGGEEDIANLVLRLAISQMVAERAGQPLSLLVLDEIFGSLDEHRRQNVVILLRRLADRFPQVVLITHIDSIRSGVDRVIRVALDEHRGAAVVTDDQGVLSDEDVAA
jgi:exonuclease SbcC